MPMVSTLSTHTVITALVHGRESKGEQAGKEEQSAGKEGGESRERRR